MTSGDIITVNDIKTSNELHELHECFFNSYNSRNSLQKSFMATSHLRILLEGQLQGLNFRLNTQELARQLNLVGFVRHLADGRIEIDAQGEKKSLEKLLTWCQDKPHAAKITSIFYLYDNELTNGSNDFTVRR